MRSTALLVFLVSVIAIPAIAADDPQSTDSSAPVVSTNPERPAPQDAVSVTGRMKSELSRKGNGPTENFNDAVCATMRTYIVARERRGSDTTQVVGYARCQPAWKFQLRTADQKIPDSPR
jgi:hypothetical protein